MSSLTTFRFPCSARRGLFCSLRPRASSSSSQSERSTSPLVMTSTHSLETMPRFALSTDDEGAFRRSPVFPYVSVWLITRVCFNRTISVAEVVVSNLRRIRIRSNSTGAKHSSPKEPTGPRRFGNQLETPDKQRLSCGGKVPKSASVSALSLIITTGCHSCSNGTKNKVTKD